MTQAVCFKCGEVKFGALLECPHCQAKPKEDEELILSLAMTDHNYKMATLLQISKAKKEGYSLQLDEELRKTLLKALEEIRRMQIGVPI